MQFWYFQQGKESFSSESVELNSSKISKVIPCNLALYFILQYFLTREFKQKCVWWSVTLALWQILCNAWKWDAFVLPSDFSVWCLGRLCSPVPPSCVLVCSQPAFYGHVLHSPRALLLCAVTQLLPCADAQSQSPWERRGVLGRQSWSHQQWVLGCWLCTCPEVCCYLWHRCVPC